MHEPRREHMLRGQLDIRHIQRCRERNQKARERERERGRKIDMEREGKINSKLKTCRLRTGKEICLLRCLLHCLSLAAALIV